LLAAAGPRAGIVELLSSDPDLLLGLVKVCAGGDLLTELLISQPELLASLANPERLLARKSKPAMRRALAAVFAPETTAIERRDRPDRRPLVLQSGRGAAGLGARRHHIGRRRLSGRPAASARQQGQWVRLERRCARAVLSGAW